MPALSGIYYTPKLVAIVINLRINITNPVTNEFSKYL